jgi:hypothetical protein
MITQLQNLSKKLNDVIEKYHHSYRAFTARLNGLKMLKRKRAITDREFSEHVMKAAEQFVRDTDLGK